VIRILQRIRKRVLFNRLLEHGAADLVVSLSFFALLLLLDRLCFPGLVTPALLGAVLLVSLSVSLLRTFFLGRLDLFRTAVLADKSLDLKERAASAVFAYDFSLGGDRRCLEGRGLEGRGFEEWGRLLEEDAARSLETVDLKRRFPVRLSRAALWALVPLAASLSFYLWLPDLDLLGVRSRREGDSKMRSVVSQEMKELDEKLAQLEKEAEKKAPDAKKLLELLRQKALKPEKEDPAGSQKTEKGAGDPKKEGLVELTRREDQIKKGLEGGKFEPLKEALKTLKSLEPKNSEVTRKVTEALKEGDFDKAKKALDDLKGELASLAGKKPSELTAEEKARLEKLSDELARLSKNSQALSKLSNALSKASAQLNSSDLSSALDSLSASRDELDSLTKLAEEMANQMDVLDQALELVKLSKEELAQLQACPECGTPYCPDCGKPRCGSKPGMKPGGT
jgi:hypothetical protein